MKKILAGVFIAGIFLLLSVSLISASLFGDIGNWFKKVFKQEREEISPTQFPAETVISVYGTAQIVSNKESRENICKNSNLIILDNQTRGDFQILCSERYEDLTQNDNEKIDEMTKTVSSINSRDEVSNYTKIIAENLLFSSLPPLQTYEYFPSYEELKEKCDKTAVEIKKNCPAKGFDFWFFRYTILFRNYTSWGYTNYIDTGGSCHGLEAGGVELMNIQHVDDNYEKLERKNNGTNFQNETIQYIKVFCYASCSSYNCPKYEKELQGVCKKGYVIYFPVDEKERQSKERIKYIDKEYIENNCERRGRITIINEKGKPEEKQEKYCGILPKEEPKGLFSFMQRAERDCGYVTASDGKQKRYCCCSCERPDKIETISFKWGEGVMPEKTNETKIQIPNRTKKQETIPERIQSSAKNIVKENQSETEEPEPEFEQAVCGDGIITFPEICDSDKFNEQCLDSLEDYKGILENPNLTLECYNNCRGCQIATPARE